jgi:DNA-binding response OmpR family regulator
MIGGTAQVDTILVVEDNRSMQRTLQRLLEADGFQVLLAGDGAAGIDSFRQQIPSAVILDLKLPKLPGKELCRSFKALAPSVPVVVLSANADVEDKVLLLELGADDYVTKPFSPKELLARLRRAIRHAATAPIQFTSAPRASAPHELLILGEITIDFTSMEASRQGTPISFTSQEFKLLKFFAGSPGRVFSRDELLNQVWGYDRYPSTRTVDNHVLRLRQKLESDPAHPRYFLTVHRTGYKFLLPPPASDIEQARR